MSAALDWSGLEAALGAQAAPPELWLRDDDAVAATPALERLLALTASHGITPVLAVIPDRLEASLPPRLRDAPAWVATHGWRHENHAPAGEKKAEFGAHRPLEMQLGELRAGRARLQEAFGAQAIDLFVPPWNRIAPSLSTALASSGHRALSTFQPRREPSAAPGVERLNTHWDPIDWPAQRAGRAALRPGQELIAALAAVLADRAAGRADAGEPLGLLTHHLIHDDGVWAFLDALLARLSGRVTWVDLGGRLRG